MLKIVYKLFKKRFIELMVEDMFGSIPKDLSEPALDFLANGKETLEKFFTLEIYKIQRKMVHDHKNSDVYLGMMIIIKALTVAITGRKSVAEKIKPIDLPLGDINKDLEKVADFIGEGINHVVQK